MGVVIEIITKHQTDAGNFLCTVLMELFRSPNGHLKLLLASGSRRWFRFLIFTGYSYYLSSPR
jgi:hypothetical protein